MGYMIEVSDEKVDGLAEHAKKILKHGRELYKCIEEIAEDSMGERGGYDRGGRYGNRYDGGSRYGDRYDQGREHDDWDDENMGERRGRSARTGRYISR